ncbi:MAG TPA: hypothetical protein VIK81_04595 [Patescibacteria group bacterium]
MPILILTGPAASGKNTISQFLSKKREKCAVIDVDLVRWMYFQPHKAPWDGEEGKVQQKFGVENACLLAKNFLKNGIEVIILDVIVNETIKLYREYFPEAKIIMLMPSFEETKKRFSRRSHTITEEEFKMVYKWQEDLNGYDEKIDNTNLTAEESADKLNSLF